VSTITKPVHKPSAGELRLRFSGVPFGTYESLIRALPERTPVRMAYDGRNLEIMVTGPVHDHFSDIISQFIHVVARAGRIPRVALGETTWIRPEIHRGLEADRCYMFDPAKIATTNALLRRVDNDVADYPNPDLAIEVDISRPQVDRPSIYTALQVPEIWTFDGEVVIIAQLSDGQYVDTGRSRWLPVTAADVTRWVAEYDLDNPDAWEDRLRAWAELLPRAEGGAP
jgi:Uma2 family endonuclease